MKKQTFIGFMLAIVFATLLLGRISVHFIPSFTKRLPVYDFKGLYELQLQKSYYALYTEHSDIVMLGNSLIQFVNWDEFLQRKDIVNRGVAGDVTKGILSRMPSVLACSPKTCFVEGGINDVLNEIPVEESIKNITAIVDTLNAHHIKAVLFKLTYVTQSHVKASAINTKVDILNTLTSKIADVHFIDMNQYLSKDGYLCDKYALPDGVHLSVEAYKILNQKMLKEI